MNENDTRLTQPHCKVVKFKVINNYTPESTNGDFSPQKKLVVFVLDVSPLEKGGGICRFHVNFPGCNYRKCSPKVTSGLQVSEVTCKMHRSYRFQIPPNPTQHLTPGCFGWSTPPGNEPVFRCNMWVLPWAFGRRCHFFSRRWWWILPWNDWNDDVDVMKIYTTTLRW